MTSTNYRLHPQHEYYLFHHGGKSTVTGSCHELNINGSGVLIDCGLFQDKDAPSDTLDALKIEFPLDHIKALIITHTHIDHIGRLPWLLAAGFDKPIYCTQATAALIPLMLDDGLKLQLGLNTQQRKRVLKKIESQICAVPYNESMQLENGLGYFHFSPAGHILGSAYINFQLPNHEIIVFSGDLGPRNTPLLPDPISPKQADYLVIETTYGNKRHDDVATRSQRLEKIVEQSLQDGGVILIPAFSVGRTQELLFDIELLIAHSIETETTTDDFWQQLPIILDSPLAQKVTVEYERFKQLWNEEVEYDEVTNKTKQARRHPLSFEQLITVNDHREHQKLVNRLASTNEAAIVVAASGMCSGGRIMNYLEALLPNQQTDVILAGYQAQGTLGRQLQDGEDYVYISNNKVNVSAQVHSMSGYSAHADQEDLMAFILGIPKAPQKIFLIHGEPKTKQIFKGLLENKEKLLKSDVIF